MPIAKKLFVGLVITGLMSAAAVDGQAAGAPAAKAGAAAKAPIVVEANELYFSDLTGQLFAKGDVVISQNSAKVLGELIQGNTKQTEVWVNGKATFVQPGTNLVGTNTRYNYGTHTGTMENVAGKVDKELVNGQNIEMLPDEIIIHNGTVTRCPAKVPDYHVSASKIEVWPGEQMIAYDVKFWLKDKVIYTMPKYRKSLKDDGASEFPQIGFYSEDGLFIKQHIEYPLSNKVSLYTDQAYYTKTGYRPVYGVSYHENRFAVDVTQGHFRDSDGYWIKKEPEFKFSLFKRQLWELPLNYTFTASYGKWTDSVKSSWHQDYNLYFQAFPIKFNETTNLDLGFGFQRVQDSYDNSADSIFRYDAVLGKQWSDKLHTWAGYHYVRNNPTLFQYDRNELSKQLDLGFTYRIDHMNKIGYAQTYDVANSRIYDQDVTWYRNLHCWEAAVTYRIKRDQFRVNFSMAKF